MELVPYSSDVFQKRETYYIHFHIFVFFFNDYPSL